MRSALVRDVAGLLVAVIGMIALTAVLATLAADHDWLRFGLLVAGLLALIVGRAIGRWDPEAAAAQRELRERGRAARMAMPPLPPVPDATRPPS